MATLKKTENCFSKPIITYCRSKLLKNAFCNTLDLNIKLPFVIKIFIRLFLSGSVTQVLLYIITAY